MKKSSKKLIFTITFIVFISISLFWAKEIRGFQKIEDVSQSQVIQYKTDPKRIVTSILTIKGEVNGDFMINRNLKLEAGKIDRVIRSDWYHNEIEITYNPIDVTKGHLKIKIELY
ncbi:hypothetical protein [Belliella aquatica]|uniref:Uncharacterized protein n=1 Tax=Belliella aquatica TaxID=1323734 RepID=A0ABQ1MSC3_9BACT|nr:hypothetical protein [Belliella aquatica]MCH7406006.1 hypothetical protein [Belliella aquatica]GGC43426.1 hypothetical protein GCM10010993_22440 [Belliella aquatica]